MRKNDKPNELDIVKKQKSEGISLVGGGIRIDALGKPIETSFRENWGKVYMVLDCSASMSGYKLDQAKQGIEDFAIDAIRKEYLVGLIKFNSRATHLCEPTKEINLLKISMREITANGSTNMVDAIKMARKNLTTFDGTKAMVIATDGQPDSIEGSLKEGLLSKRDGVEIITIGTDDAVQEFLKKLASRNDLGTKVSPKMFAKAISSAHLLLPSPKSIKPK